MLRTILFSMAILSITACQSKNDISGNIDQDFVSKFSEFSKGAVVKVNSMGGDPRYGREVAEIIEEKGLSIAVERFCMSSCAEYILPAANSLTLGERALIGFHQNPIMIDEFKMRKTTNKKPICMFGNEVEPLKALHQRRLGNANFWKEVEKQLILKKIETKDLGDCYLTAFKFKYDIWFPKSEILRTHYGLNFIGSVCADTSQCREIAIKRGFGEAQVRF